MNSLQCLYQDLSFSQPFRPITLLTYLCTFACIETYREHVAKFLEAMGIKCQLESNNTNTLSSQSNIHTTRRI